jgi:hypothetical protein
LEILIRALELTQILGQPCKFQVRAGNRRLRLLSALRAHTKVPYKMNFHRETRMALNRPWAARTDTCSSHSPNIKKKEKTVLAPFLRFKSISHDANPVWSRRGSFKHFCVVPRAAHTCCSILNIIVSWPAPTGRGGGKERTLVVDLALGVNLAPRWPDWCRRWTTRATLALPERASAAQECLALLQPAALCAAVKLQRLEYATHLRVLSDCHFAVQLDHTIPHPRER